MRALLVVLIVAVTAVAGCATPQPAEQAPRYSLRMAIEDAGMVPDPAAGQDVRTVNLDVCLLKSSPDAPGTVVATGMGRYTSLGDRDALAAGPEQWRPLPVSTMTLKLGQEGSMSVTGDAGPPQLVMTKAGAVTIAQGFDSATWLRAVVEDFDTTTGTGHVSFDVADQSDGVVTAYFKAHHREFQAGEEMSFDADSPEWQ